MPSVKSSVIKQRQQEVLSNHQSCRVMMFLCLSPRRTLISPNIFSLSSSEDHASSWTASSFHATCMMIHTQVIHVPLSNSPSSLYSTQFHSPQYHAPHQKPWTLCDRTCFFSLWKKTNITVCRLWRSSLTFFLSTLTDQFTLTISRISRLVVCWRHCRKGGLYNFTLTTQFKNLEHNLERFRCLERDSSR